MSIKCFKIWTGAKNPRSLCLLIKDRERSQQLEPELMSQFILFLDDLVNQIKIVLLNAFIYTKICYHMPGGSQIFP